MVNYDYKCYTCVDTKEIAHSMLDNPVVICDKCGNTMIKIIIKSSIIIPVDVDLDDW